MNLGISKLMKYGKKNQEISELMNQEISKQTYQKISKLFESRNIKTWISNKLTIQISE